MIKTVAGKRLLYVMAVDAEYGRHLAKLFTPVMIGVGPVEAAANLAYALGSLIHAGKKPDLVVSLGSAGSAKLAQAEVFQVSSVSYRDMDASPLGFEKGATPFLDLPTVVELPIYVPKSLLHRFQPAQTLFSAIFIRQLMQIWSIWRLTPACEPANSQVSLFSGLEVSPMAQASCSMSATGRSICML